MEMKRNAKQKWMVAGSHLALLWWLLVLCKTRREEAQGSRRGEAAVEEITVVVHVPLEISYSSGKKNTHTPKKGN